MSHTFEKVESLSNKRVSYRRIVKSLSPGFIIENFLGLYRFTWKGDNLTSMSYVSNLLSTLIPTSLVTIYVIFRIYPTAIFGQPYTFNVFIELPPRIVFAQYWFTCVFTPSIHKDKNGEIIKETYNVDTVLLLNVTDKFYKRACRESITAFLFMTLLHATFECCNFLTDRILTVGGLLFMVIHYFQDLELMISCKLVSSSNARLKVLNDYLQNVHRKDITYIAKSSKRINLQQLASAYNNIGGICSLINNVFNFPILIFLLSAFASIIFVIWSAINLYRFHEEFSVNMVFIVIGFIRYICAISILSFTCEKLLSTRNYTKILINDIIMDYDQPPGVRLQAKAFMELVEAWTLNTSVYNMFFVDITLVLKFLSVSTTYLIVVIQISHFV